MNTIAGSLATLMAAVIVAGLAITVDAGLLSREEIAAAPAAVDEEWVVDAPDPTTPLVRAVLDQVDDL